MKKNRRFLRASWLDGRQWGHRLLQHAGSVLRACTAVDAVDAAALPAAALVACMDKSVAEDDGA